MILLSFFLLKNKDHSAAELSLHSGIDFHSSQSIQRDGVFHSAAATGQAPRYSSSQSRVYPQAPHMQSIKEGLGIRKHGFYCLKELYSSKYRPRRVRAASFPARRLYCTAGMTEFYKYGLRSLSKGELIPHKDRSVF